MSPLPYHLAEIAALLPQYGPAGDTTVIIRMDGSHTSRPQRVRTILRQVAAGQTTDLTALRQQTRRQTLTHLHQPLPLAPRLLLCPLKIRLPRIPGDSTTGYINYHAVTGIRATAARPYQAMIDLAGGTVVPAIWSAATITRHLQQARLTTTPLPGDPAAWLLAHLSQKLAELIYDVLLFREDCSFNRPPK